MSATFGLSFDEVFVNPLLWGRWVESAVGSYLMNQSWEKGFSVYYWRSDKHNFAEVDFILVKDKRVVAIEVKSGRRKDNAGIHLFSEAYHPIASLIIGGDVFPLDKFLSMDIERLFSL